MNTHFSSEWLWEIFIFIFLVDNKLYSNFDLGSKWMLSKVHYPKIHVFPRLDIAASAISASIFLSPSGITTRAYLLGLLTCTFVLMKFKTTRSYGRRCTTKEGAGIRSPFSWVASLNPSRLLWLKSASACSMAFPLLMTFPSGIAQCCRQWWCVPRTHISTACAPKCV